LVHAHLQFLTYKDLQAGLQTIASQVYDPEDPSLDTDSQFGVTGALIGNYAKRADGSWARNVRERQQ
jgi:catechol 1,2-dioxygenase